MKMTHGMQSRRVTLFKMAKEENPGFSQPSLGLYSQRIWEKAINTTEL
jgi:hypothetical protein